MFGDSSIWSLIALRWFRFIALLPNYPPLASLCSLSRVWYGFQFHWNYPGSGRQVELGDEPPSAATVMGDRGLKCVTSTVSTGASTCLHPILTSLPKERVHKRTCGFQSLGYNMQTQFVRVWAKRMWKSILLDRQGTLCWLHKTQRYTVPAKTLERHRTPTHKMMVMIRSGSMAGK